MLLRILGSGRIFARGEKTRDNSMHCGSARDVSLPLRGLGSWGCPTSAAVDAERPMTGMNQTHTKFIVSTSAASATEPMHPATRAHRSQTQASEHSCNLLP